jgi:hypothetical protein
VYKIAVEVVLELSRADKIGDTGCVTSTSIHPSDQHAMRFLTKLLCAISLVAAKPIDPLVTAQRSQRVLQNHAPGRLLSHSQPIHHTTSFDAAPNSVGLLLTSAGKQQVMHVWLPLGKRIETRKSAPQISGPAIIAFVSNAVCDRRFDQPPVSPSLSAYHNAHSQLA